jgi:hypothetical protein
MHEPPDYNNAPERLLMIGYIGFPGIESVSWTDQVVPNIPDYDCVIISVPHITKRFLKSVSRQFFNKMKQALVRFLHSKGRMVVLVSPKVTVKREPNEISNLDWCPISFNTPGEAGKSIVVKSQMYKGYLSKMGNWSFYFSIPNNCLGRELTDFYGSAHDTRYEVPLNPYLESRYARVLAGECSVEIWKDKKPTGVRRYPRNESPAFTTGNIVLLPLLDRISPEEALLDILSAEIGYSGAIPEPDWTQDIEMPFVADLMKQVSEAESVIASEKRKIDDIGKRISEINSFRRLLYSTGPDLEDVVKKTFEHLGAKVSPAKYSQEECILEIDGHEFLMEVKGVSKSVSLTHLRQLNDYLLKYQEDTQKECKGILFGNAWRNLPPDMRRTEETHEFPENVVKRAEQWGISLVSSKAFFDAFLKSLLDISFSRSILDSVTNANGIARF